METAQFAAKVTLFCLVETENSRYFHNPRGRARIRVDAFLGKG